MNNPKNIRVTFTTKDGEVIEFEPFPGESVEFKTLEPQPVDHHVTIECKVKTAGVLVHGSKEWYEMMYGYRGRRYVGRKIRQARRRLWWMYKESF